MLSFEKLYAEGNEEVVFFSDSSCNLKAIIAIHDTTLGPALGGTRMWNYKTLDDAIYDVLRLSKGMTYKAAVSGPQGIFILQDRLEEESWRCITTVRQERTVALV